MHHPGDKVDARYRLEELQGHGAMSEVWRAHDETLDRTVALKILSPTADLERFRREARAVAALNHENVVRVFDCGEDDGQPFMALEWLPGGTLEERLAAGALGPDDAGWIATGMAAGLAHLHSRGLVHRDLKPANVLFDAENRPKLADFGLVRSAAGAGTLTEAGTVLGTAAYISPEQAAGVPAGPASDVYSFGVLLFRMLTGSLPFVAEDALTLIEMHRREPPPSVERLQPEAPTSLAALTAQALDKDPRNRPQNGAALLAALDAAATAAEPPSDTEQTAILAAPAERAPGRSARLTTVGTLAILFLLAAGGLVAWAVAKPASTAPGTGFATGSVAGGHTSQRASTNHGSGATATGGRAVSTRTTHAGHTTNGTTRARTTTADTSTLGATGTQSTTTSLGTTTTGTTTSTTTTTPTTTTTATTTATDSTASTTTGTSASP
jgi:eukaryotic-like serine/threonine-protein kinase